MLKGIPSIISPDLLKTLMEMGHGDEIVICDANCPAMRLMNGRCLRSDVKSASELVEAILQLMPLDVYEKPVYLMEKVPGDEAVPTENWDEYEKAIRSHTKEEIVHIERFAFYDKMKGAYMAVVTADERPYGNIILKKGVFN